MKTFLTLIGFFQLMAILGAFALALGRVSAEKKWKIPDLFWANRLEEFFIRILRGK